MVRARDAFFYSKKTINVIKTFKHWIGVTGEQTARKGFFSWVLWSEFNGLLWREYKQNAWEYQSEGYKVVLWRILTWKWIIEIFCGSEVMWEIALECSFVYVVVKLTWKSVNWVWSSFKIFFLTPQQNLLKNWLQVFSEKGLSCSGVMFVNLWSDALEECCSNSGVSW